MSVGYSILVVAVTGFLAWALFKLLPALLSLKARNKAMAKFPFRSPVHWLMGNIPQARSAEGYLKFCTEMMLEHGRAFSMWFSTTPLLYLCHPDTIREGIKNTEAKPRSGLLKGYAMVEPWIGEGLLLASGEKWERNRKLLTPAFHFDILRPYIKVYQEAAEKCSNNFKKLIAKSDSDSVEVSEPLGLCTLDIMLTCALSFQTDLQENGHPYEKAVGRLMELVRERSVHPLYLVNFIWWRSKLGKEFQDLCDYTHQISGNVIKARQESLKDLPEDAKKSRHLDFLDILLTARDENGTGLTFKEIRDEVDTFLFEGHDTTKAALSWCLYCLGKYPEEQRKVREEVIRVFADKQELEWEDIQQLQYTSLFLKEVLRMYPSAPQISRVTTRPVTIDGIELPEGSTIEVHIYALHHNPLIWKDPETFKPARFSLENFAKHDPYSFIPFSAGPRNCIGQVFALNEIKTVLACLVKWFEFGFDEAHEDKVLLQPLGTLKSKHGIKVRVTPCK
ncbi:cytochrome P450 4F12-like [Liolophura sinensis]|uniref:cytochrome P450 4F12-like n=1 Tax=Liolophura sinensis TaxID=3198878 RepID=UPI0031598452